MQFTMVDFFSGCGNVSAMFRKDPTHVVASYEKNDSRSMDFMSPAGLAFLGHCSVYFSSTVISNMKPFLIWCLRN